MTNNIAAIESSTHLAPLRNQKSWCVWKFEPSANGGTKLTKVPYCADNPTRKASTTHPEGWTSFEAASIAMRSGGFSGIGYLIGGGLIAAFDLDDCRDLATGAITPWARKLIDEGRTYVEITPSGAGLRIIGYCGPKSSPVHCKIPAPGGGSVEIYRKTARYIAVSGNVLPGHDVELSNIDALVDFHRRSDLPAPKPETPHKTPHDSLPRKPLPPDLLEAVESDPPVGTRSEKFFSVVAQLKENGLDQDEIAGALDGKPLAEKYKGRLDREIARIRAKVGRDEAPAPRGNGVTEAFVKTPAGEILRQLPDNTRIAIARLGVAIRYNEFMARIEITGLPGFGPELSDPAAVRLQLLIGETFRFLPADILFHKVIVDVAHKNRFHPVRDYLDGLSWDGVPRIENWLCRYLGGEETAYNAEVGRCFLIAMVARIYRPGCKQDYMLILEGPQGVLKSTGCKTLAGEEYFSDGLPDLRSGKDVSQHLPGKWLIEIGELSAMSKTETTKIKEFVTRTTEKYRKSYGHYEVTEPRQCVFVGTTNDDCYLRDATGGRRFWPVACGEFDLEALEADRDQLFAEATHLFKAGANWWPNRHFEEVTMKPQQDARYEADVWEEPIMKFVEGRPWVSVCQVARDGLGIDISRAGTADQRRIGSALKRLRWQADKDYLGRFYHPTGVDIHDVKWQRVNAARDGKML